MKTPSKSTSATPAAAAASPSGDPYLLTPGPLTTSLTVKQAMLRDYGSRDQSFIDLTARVLRRLAAIVGDGAGGDGTDGDGAGGDPGDLVAVPMQGSGTFAVEAMLGCFVPADGKVLICINGAYGRRMAEMCDYNRRAYSTLEWAEDTPVDPAQIDRQLRDDDAITQVAVVHCETTSGILNPLAAVAEAVAARGRRLLVDAMSAFGALPLDAATVAFDAVAASANKCLEGVPGVGFCIANRSALAATEGNSPSLALDLHAQWRALQGNGQWRFTPPTQVLLALHQALDEFDQEGGVAGRGKRYRRNCKLLINGMRALGFETLLADELQAPIIVTFRMPAHPRFQFDAFYENLREQGYVIYPGKLTVADSFRIGCIGRLGEAEMNGALAAVRRALDSLGIDGRVDSHT